MEILQLIFFTAIVIAAIVRVSILPGKVWIPFVLCCGVVAVILISFVIFNTFSAVAGSSAAVCSSSRRILGGTMVAISSVNACL